MTLFEATKLTAWYRFADQELSDAFGTAHDRISVCRMDRQSVKVSAIYGMLAVNAHSRIIIARNLCDQIAGQLCINEYWEHERPIFFLTIIPKAGITGTGLRGFDPKEITSRLRVHLRGLDYLAVVEPGYFASLPPSDQISGTQAISWHAHALLWNMTIGGVSTLIDKLSKNDAYNAVVPEMPAVHARQVNNGELPAVVGYLLKPPSNAKRIQCYPWVKSGEIVRYADGSIKRYMVLKPSTLQKSERLRLFHAMKHLTLNQLFVAGGEGTIIRSNALHALDREVSARISA